MTLRHADLNQSHKFDLNDDLKPIVKMWANYILGVPQQLKEKGFSMKGFKMSLSFTVGMLIILSILATLYTVFW